MENISVGDLVKIECVDAANMRPNAELKKMTGRVISIFNALDKDGDNWIIEVRSNTQWFLYKPKLDGGTISVLEKCK
jgi:hypothetical protein